MTPPRNRRLGNGLVDRVVNAWKTSVWLHHRHGSVVVGRALVAVSCLLVLWVNALIFKQASDPRAPLPVLKGVAVITLLWMFAGASALCRRKAWGRTFVLTILYAGTFASFIWGIIILGTADTSLAGGVKPTFVTTGVYLYTSLVLTHSKHVRRLTSRIYE
jgi:hypothetical protein